METIDYRVKRQDVEEFQVYQQFDKQQEMKKTYYEVKVTDKLFDWRKHKPMLFVVGFLSLLGWNDYFVSKQKLLKWDPKVHKNVNGVIMLK